ncbi:serine protease [Mycolicibacterium moriokaense]|nr:serine protease [Mycolicibacterium moriokaense]
MVPVRVATAISALVVVVAGCSGVIADALHRTAADTSPSTSAPDLAASSQKIAAKSRPSVVKVRGESESCAKITQGSGFVVAPKRVMTAAHVVAGAQSFSVDADGKPYEAQVISYDAQADVAILDVPDLAAEPLQFAEYTAGTGVDALVLGYPGAASFTASPAKIREVIDLNGPDIYHSSTVTRQVYVLMGSFPSAGSSGGAVVDLYGRVLGLYFGAESHDSTTGFAVTAAQVAPQMAKAVATQATDTGDCVY